MMALFRLNIFDKFIYNFTNYSRYFASSKTEGATSTKPKRKTSKTQNAKTKESLDSSIDANLLLPDTFWDSMSQIYSTKPVTKSEKVQNPIPKTRQRENVAKTRKTEELPAEQPKQSENLHSQIIPDETQKTLVKSEITQITFPLILSEKLTAATATGILTLPLPNGYKQNVPSVTQVLRETMSEESSIVLAMWRKRKIAEVGEEGLKTYMRDIKATGKDLHLSIETHLRGVAYDSVFVQPKVAGYWLSLRSVFSSVSEVRALESFVVHPELQYKGCVDCIAQYKDTLVVIDWKTSQRQKSTLEATYDDPLQLAAYVGAINADPAYPFEVDNAVVVVSYPSGLPADVHHLDREQCEKYWDLWLQRLSLYRSKLKETEKQ